MGKRIKYTLRIDEDIYRAVCRIAKRNREDNADLIRRLIMRYLESEDSLPENIAIVEPVVCPPYSAIPENITGYVYVFEDGTGLFKVGHSIEPKERLRGLQTGSARQISLVEVFECDAGEMERIEGSIHAHLSEKRFRGEWCSLCDEDITWIRNHVARENANGEA